MAKQFLEDMVKAKKAGKEIRDIRIAPRVVTEEPRKIYPPHLDKKRPRYMLWIVAGISVIFLFFAFTFLFSKAEVSINPKISEVTLNENLSATKDSTTDALPFDLVVISGEEDKTLTATTMQDVKNSATGTAILYNAYSTSPQPLSIDTRLEGSNGKMYKTTTKITIPGMSKTGTPGSVAVKIYASAPGPDYNSPPLDFKIFGFKGTPKYAKIYGRGKGDISGGFIGKAPIIASADKTSAIIDLKTALQAKLLQKATDQIPDGYILFKDAIFLNTDDSNISSTINKDNSLALALKGTLYGLLLNEQKLTQKIAQDSIDKYDGSDVYIPNIRNLTFALANKDNVSFSDVKTINFSLTGLAKIAWKVDVNKFTTDILGKSKSDFNQVLSQYPNINSATLTVSPAWKMSIPNQASDIKITVNYPQ